jgi:ABC-2 type transport system permease protein
LVVTLVMGQLGELLKFPQALLNVSPFTHAPKVPAEPFEALPLIVLLAIAAALGGLAFWGFRRRSLAIPA